MEALVITAFTSFVQLGAWVLIPTALVISLSLHPITTAIVLAAYSLSYLDGSERKASARVWPEFSKNFWLFRFMRGFFRQRVHMPDGFDCKQFILCIHPHGSMADYRALVDGQLHELLGGRSNIRWLAASVLFRLPVVRELCLWTSCVDASRPVAERMLREGLSLGILPGGEQEQLRTTYRREAVYLQRRKGFVKLAIRHGVPLVPAYVFGCTDLYRTSRFMYGLRRALVSVAGVCIPLCWGPFGMPLTPFKGRVDIVVGEPIPVKKEEEPTDEDVARLHETYVKALCALFDKNKGRFGYDDRTLTVE